MGYVLVAAICLVVGLFIGFGSGVTLIEREEKNAIANSPNCDEVLIDAKTNREIAQAISSRDQSEKGRLLAQLTEMINKAAQQGKQRLYIEDHNLNVRIKRCLSKKDISSYFSAGGYRVEFMYKHLEDPEINFISWE